MEPPTNTEIPLVVYGEGKIYVIAKNGIRKYKTPIYQK